MGLWWPASETPFQLFYWRANNGPRLSAGWVINGIIEYVTKGNVCLFGCGIVILYCTIYNVALTECYIALWEHNVALWESKVTNVVSMQCHLKLLMICKTVKMVEERENYVLTSSPMGNDRSPGSQHNLWRHHNL